MALLLHGARHHISCPRHFSFWRHRTPSNSKALTRCPRPNSTASCSTILDYLSAEDETKVIDLTTTTRTAQVQPVTNAEEILEFQRLIRMVPIAESVGRYVVDLVRATRQNSGTAPDFVKKYVNYGASVRAAQFIVLSAKARALSRHRFHVSYEDVKSLAIPVLRHRILLNFHAESDRIDSDEILRRLIEQSVAAWKLMVQRFLDPAVHHLEPRTGRWRPWSRALWLVCIDRPISDSARSLPSTGLHVR